MRLWICALTLALAACNYNHPKGDAAAAGPNSSLNRGAGGSLDQESVDYQAISQNVIGPRCATCHNRGDSKGGVALDSYTGVKAASPRIIDRALERKDMPPGRPLSAAEAAALESWINAGMPEALVGTVEKPDPALDRGPTDFAKIRDHVFKNKCLDCHSGAQAMANLDLSSHEQVKSHLTVIFERIFVKGDMPVEPYPSLTPKERKVLLKWFDAGAPR